MNTNKSSLKKTFDVVGIGNAIVDVLVNTDDAFLHEHELVKGSMALIDQEKAGNLLLASGNGVKSSGGSVANTLASISELGSKAGFIGRVKNDDLGKIFNNDIAASGTIYKTPATIDGPSTARCLIFITPDAERTMCTYLGASIMLEPKDVDISMVRETKVLYLEGYLWDNPVAKKAFIQASIECKEAKGKIALSLSDSFCVERHRDSFQQLLEDYVDILFANESEILALYRSQNLEDAIRRIKGKCEVVVITLGQNGSIVISREEKYKITPYNFGKVIDTTGAGDSYAGGFLYGYTNNKDWEVCGNLGSICSGYIVTQIGPRSKFPLKELVKNTL